MAAAPEMGRDMRAALLMLMCALALPAKTFYLTVAGLGGDPDYEQRFAGWAKDLENTEKSGGVEAKVITLYGPGATKTQVKDAFRQIQDSATRDDALVFVLIGHGTWDGYDYKFNLPGDDITAFEISKLLDEFPGKELVVNTTSASGASLNLMQKPDRVIITATKSGNEKNATVFARYWVEALRDPGADTDKNGVISALEAYHYAQQKTANFYNTQNRIPTEHSMLNDTGKGEGVRDPSPQNGEGRLAASFSLIRLGSEQQVANNPEKRTLLQRKQTLEEDIDKLKYRKAAMDSTEYRQELTKLLVELAKVQAEIDKP
jgi:hypothetical protein